METKELKITPPDGYEIDRENSTFECIKFKPIARWVDDEGKQISGWYISSLSDISEVKNQCNIPRNYNMFATEKLAKSALAMARISQIMANDSRFGGAVTDMEWKDDTIHKYCIARYRGIIRTVYQNIYYFLAFHTEEQRELFIKENEQLVKDYLMIE